MTTLQIKVTAEIDRLEIDRFEGGRFANYTALVSLTDHQGFARYGDPVTLRHTLYIDDDGEPMAPTDGQDFVVVNDGLLMAFGVFADSLRDDVLSAIHTAAAEAVRGELAEAGAAGEGTV